MVLISVVAEKGGVGKSTFAALMAQTLGFAGKRVLSLDMDQQADCTKFLAVENPPRFSAVDLFTQKCTVEQFVEHGICKSGNSPVHVIPGSLHLVDLYERFPDTTAAKIREAVGDRFGRLVKYLSSSYDFIIIDFPPGVDSTWFSLLKLSAQIVVPVLPRILSKESAVRSLLLFQSKLSIPSERITILPNSFSNTPAHRAIVQELRDFFTPKGCWVVNTPIPQSAYFERVLESDESLFIRWFGDQDAYRAIISFVDLAVEMYEVDKTQILNTIKIKREQYLQQFRFKKLNSEGNGE